MIKIKMEKTVTFTMEDALISPVGLAVLSGAGLLEGKEDTDDGTYLHATETSQVVTGSDGNLYAGLTYEPSIDADNMFYMYVIPLDSHGDISGQPVRVITLTPATTNDETGMNYDLNLSDISNLSVEAGDLVMVDYYHLADETKQVVTQINIDAENFAGYYYLEAATLWRNKDGNDIEAEFIIPNCKIQSNFTFSMASSGDPSTFSFTMDAFPDYTKYDHTVKVLCAIRVVEDVEGDDTDATSGQTTTYGNSTTVASGSRTKVTDDEEVAKGSGRNWRANKTVSE